MFPGFFHATAFVTMMLLRYSDDHPHVAMVNTAEVMADNGVHPRRLGRDGEFSGASGQRFFAPGFSASCAIRF